MEQNEEDEDVQLEGVELETRRAPDEGNDEKQKILGKNECVGGLRSGHSLTKYNGLRDFKNQLMRVSSQVAAHRPPDRRLLQRPAHRHHVTDYDHGYTSLPLLKMTSRGRCLVRQQMLKRIASSNCESGSACAGHSCTGTHVVHVMCIRRGMILISRLRPPWMTARVAVHAPATGPKAVPAAAPVSLAPAPVGPSAVCSSDHWTDGDCRPGPVLARRELVDQPLGPPLTPRTTTCTRQRSSRDGVKLATSPC